MTQEQLHNIVNHGKGVRIEFKEVYDPVPHSFHETVLGYHRQSYIN